MRVASGEARLVSREIGPRALHRVGLHSDVPKVPREPRVAFLGGQSSVEEPEGGVGKACLCRGWLLRQAAPRCDFPGPRCPVAPLCSSQPGRPCPRPSHVCLFPALACIPHAR